MELVSIAVGRDSLDQSQQPLSKSFADTLEGAVANDPTLWIDGPEDGTEFVFKSLSFPMGEGVCHVLDWELVQELCFKSHVKGYVRKDGTFVAAHYRTGNAAAPDQPDLFAEKAPEPKAPEVRSKVGDKVTVGGGRYVIEPTDSDYSFPPVIASYEVKDGHLFYHGRDGSEGVVGGTKEQLEKWVADVNKEIEAHPPFKGREWTPADGGKENTEKAIEAANKASDIFGLKHPDVRFSIVDGNKTGEHNGDGTVDLFNPHNAGTADLNFETPGVTATVQAAAHEVAHTAFASNPELGYEAVQALGKLGTSVSMYHALAGDHEGLMDAASAYVHSPGALKHYSPEVYRIVEAWANQLKAANKGHGRYQALTHSLQAFAKESAGSLRERLVVIDRLTGKTLADTKQELHLNAHLQHEPTPDSEFTNADQFDEHGEYHPDGSILHFHTHPRDETFSDADWRIFARSTIGEMRVVSANKVYALEKTKEFADLPWQKRTPKVIGDKYEAILGKVVDESSGTSDEAITAMIDEATVRMAKEMGVKYTITPLTDAEHELTKAQAIPAGARWITVHPNPGAKGQPVLVQPDPHTPGAMHVIGGAGGKLNYLKLRGVKSVEHYRQEAAERHSLARQAKREQTAKDKVLGIHVAKAAAKKAIQQQKLQAEREFIQTVADAMGWDLTAPAVDGTGDKAEGEQPLAATAVDMPGFPAVDGVDGSAGEASDGVSKALIAKQHQALLTKAKAAVELQRQVLIADPQKRQEAFQPTSADALATTSLDATDLVPVRTSTGSGFVADFKERAAKAGLTPEALQAEVASIAAQGDPALAMKLAVKKADKAEVAKQVKAAVDQFTASNPDLKPVVAEAKMAVKLLEAHKALQKVQAKARAANAEIDTSEVEPKAYVLAVSPVTSEEVEQDVADSLRTAAAQTFLAQTGKASRDALQAPMATGAFNGLNAVSQALGGRQLIDRSVVDVLGVGGAAQVLARRMAATLGPEEVAKVTAAMEQFHAGSQTQRTEATLEQVDALHAAALDMDGAGHGDDILFKAQLARRRAEHLAEANTLLGQTLGELEGHAALVAALNGPPQEITVAMGRAPLVDAVRQCRALGMEPGDYELTRDGQNVFLKVKSSGMDRLSANMDPDNLARVRRNLDLMEGKQDENGWLPQGFANRADLAAPQTMGVSASIAEPFQPGTNLSESLRDHIGSRFADGESPGAIVADIQSAEYFQKAGSNAAYRAALDAVAPNKVNGKALQGADDLADTFQQYADEFCKKRYGTELTGLNKQQFQLDATGQDAVHRALADHPEGVLAYKPVGELSPHEMRGIRDWFGKNIAHDSPERMADRKALEDHIAAEPQRYSEDMFGEQSESPDWQAWDSARSELADKLKSSGLTWADYAKALGGPHKAVAAVQDLIKSRVAEAFARHHNTLKPAQPLRVGRMTVRNALGHLAAVDPKAREAKLQKEKALIDSLRNRVGGKYSGGSVADKLEAAAAQQAAFEQSQMGFFGGELFAQDKGTTPLAQDERHTLGHAAEQQLASAIGVIGKQFKPGQPVKLFNASMSGEAGAVRQRAIKHILENKRSVLGLGVGSGKTSVMLGAFAHLHRTGKVKKGIFAVPSIVQGQFGAEALRFLEPGAFKWHAEPGASREERFAAYKDPDTHFSVVTHAAMRDDIAHAVGQHLGKTRDEALAHLETLPRAERQKAVDAAFGAMGIKFDFAAFDEAHGLLDRAGKADSKLSMASQALTDGTEYYAHASGDPIKNDASELHSLLSKMDPQRYADRDAFMRAYGGDTVAAKDGLQREMARHVYAASLSPDVSVKKSVQQVPLSSAQEAALATLDANVGKARLAKLEGKVDVPAVQALMPDHFAGVPEDEHEKIAASLMESLPLVRDSATKRILDSHPQGGKLDAIAKLAADRKGKPGVIFARSLAQVEHIRKRLEAEGHRVATISGADSAADKDAKIRGFNPEAGDRAHDIVVCSDAAATGANLQSGSWLVESDTPDTAMVHAQRAGRINRIGQKNDVELIDLMHDHPAEHRARKRLANKYELRDLVTSPLAGMDDSGLGYFLKQQQAEAAQAALV